MEGGLQERRRNKGRREEDRRWEAKCRKEEDEGGEVAEGDRECYKKSFP